MSFNAFLLATYFISLIFQLILLGWYLLAILVTTVFFTFWLTLIVLRYFNI